MPEIQMNIKPLSVNECWQGRRYKTDKYRSYEKQLLYTLPEINMPGPPIVSPLSSGYQIYLLTGIIRLNHCKTFYRRNTDLMIKTFRSRR